MSTRWKNVGLVEARAPLGAQIAKPERDRANTRIPHKFIVTLCPTRRALNADTWRSKGGMMGGANGSCRGVTSNNGIGIVPQAFIK